MKTSRYSQGDVVRRAKLGLYHVERVEPVKTTHARFYLHLVSLEGRGGIVVPDNDSALSRA